MKHVRIPDFSHPAPVRITVSSNPVRVLVDRRYRNLPDDAPGTTRAMRPAIGS